MSTPINDGGPVYPTTTIAMKEGDAIKFNVTHGITLRDYFAGQALAGMLANSSARGAWATYVEHSYAQADAMIAARTHQEDAK